MTLKKYPIANYNKTSSTSKSVQCPWHTEFFYPEGLPKMNYYSFERQRLDDPVSLENVLIGCPFQNKIIIIIKKRNKCGRGGRQFFHFSCVLTLLFTWCGQLSRPLSTVCVWAVWSPPRSRPCLPSLPPCRPGDLVLEFRGSFGRGKSPPASPQSTGSPPCPISPSPTPPVGGGRGGRGRRRSAWGVVQKGGKCENTHRAGNMDELKQEGGRGEWGEKLDLVKTLVAERSQLNLVVQSRNILTSCPTVAPWSVSTHHCSNVQQLTCTLQLKYCRLVDFLKLMKNLLWHY